MIYEAINKPVLSHVPKTVKRILDIGCGAGTLGKSIKHDTNCEAIGITYSATESEIAAQFLDQVIVCDINDLEPSTLGSFDCIICSHILEHLYRPEELLQKLHGNLNPDGLLIVALPNPLHWKQRLEFMKGNFKYTEGGVMDKTHFRFFDWDTARELVQKSGFQILTYTSDGYFPLPAIRKVVKPIASRLDQLATQLLPGLFGFQFIIVAQLAK